MLLAYGAHLLAEPGTTPCSSQFSRCLPGMADGGAPRFSVVAHSATPGVLGWDHRLRTPLVRMIFLGVPIDMQTAGMTGGSAEIISAGQLGMNESAGRRHSPLRPVPSCSVSS